MAEKAIEDMSLEEIEEARAEIKREREALRAPVTPEELEAVREIATDAVAGADSDEPEAEPWPHQVLEYKGMTMQVRKPDESALVAISMTGTPGLTPQAQMRIFSKFLANHMSPETFVDVVESMTDPDAGIDIKGLIQALTQL